MLINSNDKMLIISLETQQNATMRLNYLTKIQTSLTPKPKDVELLLRMLDYRDNLQLVKTGELITKTSWGATLYSYEPPEVDDFRVYEVESNLVSQLQEAVDLKEMIKFRLEKAGIAVCVSPMGCKMSVSPSLENEEVNGQVDVSKPRGSKPTKMDINLKQGSSFFLKAGVELEFFPPSAEGLSGYHVFVATY